MFGSEGKLTFLLPKEETSSKSIFGWQRLTYFFDRSFADVSKFNTASFCFLFTIDSKHKIELKFGSSCFCFLLSENDSLLPFFSRFTSLFFVLMSSNYVISCRSDLVWGYWSRNEGSIMVKLRRRLVFSFDWIGRWLIISYSSTDSRSIASVIFSGIFISLPFLPFRVSGDIPEDSLTFCRICLFFFSFISWF